MITLALGLEGGEHLFSYLSHVQEVLPSGITQLGLGYGSDRFVMGRCCLAGFCARAVPGTELTYLRYQRLRPGLRRGIWPPLWVIRRF